MTTVKATAPLTYGIDEVEAEQLQQQEQGHDQCEPCIMGKQQKFLSHEPARNRDATLPGQRWFMDSAGGGNITPTMGGARHALYLTDEATDMMSFYLLPTRDSTPITNAVEDVIKKSTAKGYRVSYLRSDNTKEFSKGSLPGTLESHGVE